MNKIVILFLTLTTLGYSHPGRLDADGGHWDRKNGTYHYHRYNSSTSSGNSSSYYKKETKNSTAETVKNTTPKKKKVLMSEDEIYTRLLWLGYSGEDAIIKFQQDNNLTPDGIAGAKTIKLLKEKTNY